nr:hypothetical protein [Tanacetum cinerariifolium]
MHPPSPDYVLGPEHPPSPDYVPGHEHPPTPAYAPEFVLEPVYLDFMPLEDDVLSAEEQPLPATALPTVDSPGNILESDLEEDLIEHDEDPKDDPADYPTDREDDEEESSKDNANDKEEDENEDEDEEEDEHPAPADSIPPPVHRSTARISISAQAPIPFLSEAEVERLLSLLTPTPSPLTPYSSPLPQIPSPPLPASPTYPLGYRAVMIRASMAMMRAVAPSTYILAPRLEIPPSGTPPLLPIPIPTSSPPLLLPSTDRRADVLEVTLPPRKRLPMHPPSPDYVPGPEHPPSPDYVPGHEHPPTP